ncbi:hypothetical protein ACQ86N_25845 [Puia sp. P3]|uniref:hypothetical protein n=1 Tax=Puia sp. P3 TaxID=3423952 RepID=UPI003D677EF3
MQTASIEFLQQFREETIRLPRSQRSLFFRPFPGIKKEKILLDRLVEERLTRTSLLRELIVKLIQQDQAVGRRTSEHAKKILATFSAIVRMDPSSAQYLIRLSKEIRQLLDWIVSYQGQTETTLLNRLKCIASKKTATMRSGFSA